MRVHYVTVLSTIKAAAAGHNGPIKKRYAIHVHQPAAIEPAAEHREF
jgi:hypothetical protein